MLLHDSLEDAVADVSADLPALAATARNRGLSIRRRRRALATVGSVAAATVLAIGAVALVPGTGAESEHVATDIAAPVDAGPLRGQSAPATARGVAAALAATVDTVADGTFGRFQGDATRHEGLAALLFEPVTGTGPAGQVFLNLQPIAMGGRPPYACAGYLEEYITDCRVRELPNGDTLRTYRQDDDTEFGRGSQRVVAEVLSPARRLRVIVSAMNTNPWATGTFRDQPVLTTEQLTRIATQSWWSRHQLPVEYVEAGEGLADYADADAG